MPATLRTQDTQHYAHVAFFEGIPLAFTDDKSGELWGNGLNSWIGNSESSIAGEAVGGRTVVPGLVLPRGMADARDPRTGTLLSRPLKIKLQDNAAGDETNRIASLFADVPPDDIDFLGETVQAGTTDLAASLIAWGQGATLNPRGRYVGIERIGDSGERHMFPVVPLPGVGYQHVARPNLPPPEGPPQVPVTDSPLVWDGRRCVVYRIYRDMDASTDDWQAWPLWDDQYEANNILWRGKASGLAEVTGYQEWSIQMRGADSWLRRKLNTQSSTANHKIETTTVLRDEERYISVLFVGRGQAIDGGGGAPFVTFQGSVFDQQLSATGTKKNYRDEIDAIIQGQFDGTDAENVNVGGSLFNGWTEGGDPQNPDVGLDDFFRFYIAKDNEADPLQMRWGEMRVVLHDKVWRSLGFQPETQNAGFPMTKDWQAQLVQLMPGAPYHPTYGGTEDVPSSDYWEGIFTTIRLDTGTTDPANGITWGPETSGTRRNYKPAFNAQDTFYLDYNPGQTVYLPTGRPFVEGQNTLVPLATAEVDGVACNRARLAVFYGKRATIGPDSTEEELAEAVDEAEDFFAVAQVSWPDGGTWGAIRETALARPGVHIDRWLDARAFGFDVPKHDRRWIANNEAATIHMRFLASWPYMVPGGNAPEYANAVFSQVLLSSGSGTGINVVVLDEGENSPNANANYLEGGDWEIADMGLGIPHQLVATPTEIRSAFNDVPGGVDGPLNRVRYGYSDSVTAQDVLDSILRPRRLGWRLHGNVFGIHSLGAKSQDDVDVTITEDDLYGEIGDPRTVIPAQKPGALGAFDDFELSYRWRPFDGGETAGHLRAPAKDFAAQYRTGDHEISLKDHGLLVPHWYANMLTTTGTSDWRELLKDLWQHDAAEFFAARHDMVTIKVGPHVSMDCRVGTVVRITNAWLRTPAGEYGVSNAIGTIEESVQHPDSGAATLKILLYGGRFSNPVMNAPIAKIVGWTGSTFTVEADHYRHGTDRSDSIGFRVPSYATQTGNVTCDVLQYSGRWTRVNVGRVSSVDVDNHTITFEAAIPSTILRDADKYLVLRSYDNQPADSFARELYGVICSDDLRHSAANVAGRKLA